ncbi:GNAT family N-acetyltransferase [Streptomyces phaeofaciens]|uniref:GNAT family N-acetyltransferase n=1 Tax=Streptomyces phaeofaciens TaxID=68254 RepID=UPI0016779391|nr:GNAT family N-acetyltransferase [Streptomyces phaeofaciens]
MLPAPHPAPLRVPAAVRPAHPDDAEALAALSRPFVRTGALRERPVALYAARAADFVVVQAPDGTLDGCLALRVHEAGPVAGPAPSGVLYNFCVAPHRQGHGVGSGLLRAVMARARARSVGTLFTATVGGGGLFLRYGFGPASSGTAPAAWTASLDPRRNARVLARTL